MMIHAITISTLSRTGTNDAPVQLMEAAALRIAAWRLICPSLHHLLFCFVMFLRDDTNPAPLLIKHNP